MELALIIIIVVLVLWAVAIILAAYRSVHGSVAFQSTPGINFIIAVLTGPAYFVLFIFDTMALSKVK
jgi:flagellar basal body-associated protein FliL